MTSMMTSAQAQSATTQDKFYEAAALLFLYTETPLHAGTGASLGIVDLPIQREVHTQYPMIQGSSVKGALRTRARQEWGSLPDPNDNNKKRGTPKEIVIFGPEGDNASDHSSSLIVSDARILLFPVRSLEGVFHYVTSADVLARFARDCQRAEITSLDAKLKGLEPPKEEIALLANNAKSQITLEEFTYSVQSSPKIGELARTLSPIIFPDALSEADFWRKKLAESLVVLPEADFRDFTLYATQIIQRIRLDSATKTVERGGLWSEECLPSDTLLYAPVFATNPRQGNGANGGGLTSGQGVIDAVRGLFESPHSHSYIQLGGDETVGYGQVAARWWLPEQAKGGAQ